LLYTTHLTPALWVLSMMCVELLASILVDLLSTVNGAAVYLSLILSYIPIQTCAVKRTIVLAKAYVQHRRTMFKCLKSLA